LESVMAAKKYMLPLVAVHPYIGGGLLVEYFGHQRFDPARNALIMDSQRQLDSPMTRSGRLTYQSRLDELSQSGSVIDRLNEGKANDGKNWERLQASAQPGLDAFRQPVLQIRVGDDLAHVGLSRANILNISEPSELAVRLLEARLRQELRPATARRTSHIDVEKDLAMLKQLLSLPRREVAVRPSSTNDSRAQATSQ